MNYDEQYYILMDKADDLYPNLVADTATASRDYDFDPLPPFSMPVVFKNATAFEHPEWKDKFHTYPFLKTLSSFIVTKDIYLNLRDLIDLKKMKFHPAVYISDDDNMYENYWYLNIYSDFDCWDREKSKYDSFLGDDSAPEIEKYVLNSDILNEVKEEDRLIFRMGWDLGSNLFVHQRIIDYFESANITGYRAFKVSEYEFGMEFRS